MTHVMAGLSSMSPSTNDVDERVAAAVTEHHDLVWRLLRRFGVAEAEADDAAQQVFCVFAKRAREVPHDKEKTFLFGVVVRVAQATRRDRTRRAEVSDDDAIASVATTARGPDEQLDVERQRALLDRLLEDMPFELRTVFVLYEIEEMTMAEIATTLALRPGTVASRLRRARETFRELGRRMQEERGLR